MTVNFSDLSIIIPTINEKENLQMLLPELAERYPGAHLLVVDDGSTDGTDAWMREKVDGECSVPLYYLQREDNVILTNYDPFDQDQFTDDELGIRDTAGLTASVLDALSILPTKKFAVMDADLQHPPELIHQMYDNLQEHDLVYGYRASMGDFPLHRRLVSKVGNTMANLALPPENRVHDPLSGAFAGNREVLEPYLQATSQYELEGFKVLFNLLKQLPSSVSVGETGFTFRSRRGGNSKIGVSQIRSFYYSLFGPQERRFLLGAGMLLLINFLGLLAIIVVGDTHLSAMVRRTGHRYPSFKEWSDVIARYGNYPYYALFLMFIGYGAVFDRKWLRVGLFYLGFQLLVSVLLVIGLKAAVGRPRPQEEFLFQPFSSDNDYKSFPSGHATDAFTSAGTLWMSVTGYVVPVIAVLYSSFIAFTRVVEGRHYVSDILAGSLLGFVFSTFAFMKWGIHRDTNEDSDEEVEDTSGKSDIA